MQVLGIGVNTILTVLIGAVVSLLIYSNKQQSKQYHDDTMAAVKDFKLEVIDKFVTKADFQSSLTTYSVTTTKLWEKESATSETLNKSLGDINLKLQHLEDSIPKTK